MQTVQHVNCSNAKGAEDERILLHCSLLHRLHMSRSLPRDFVVLLQICQKVEILPGCQNFARFLFFWSNNASERQPNFAFLQGAVVGISIAIVVIIFGVNPFGTVRIGGTYAPIVLLWFLFNIITACYNINKYNRGIFKAFSPYFGELSLLVSGLLLEICNV